MGTSVIVQGTVDSHGFLKLDCPVPLPPGAVDVTIQPSSQASERAHASSDSFLATMEEIWAGQRARGHNARSKEAIDAEIAAIRDEAESELTAVERLHAECRPMSSQPLEKNA